MKPLARLALLPIGTALLALPAAAQVPDLLNALDAGGRAMATGGANSATNVDTFSILNNPAALGYLDTRAVDVAYRNLPTSRTRLTGDFDDPSADSNGRRGKNAISHLGFATPVRDLFGRGSGTIGVSYTIAGYIDDHATATTLSDDNGFNVQNYDLRRKAQTSFYTISYGKAVNGGLSYGLGLVVASQELRFSQTGTNTDGTTNIPVDASGSSTGTGVGVVGGVLFTPKSQPEWTLGLSLRSPIELSGNGETQGQYDRIPGRALLGATWRREGFRGGKDYLLIGGQVQNFFGGQSSDLFDRNGQTGFGLGAEYNVGVGDNRVPLRFGFSTLPGGGDGFASRNAFTFGLGFRSGRYPVGLDLSYAVPENGGNDFSIAASYRFK